MKLKKNKSTSIGELIRKLRSEKDLTMVQLAEKSKLSKYMIASIEHGTLNPSDDCLQAISEVLGTSIDYLKDGIVDI